MDVVAIGGVIEAVKTLAGMAKTTAEAVVDEKQREKLYEIRQGLMELQARVLDDQLTRMELVAELERTRNELSELKAQKANLDAYSLTEVAPGRFVFRAANKEPSHFACPNCRGTHGRISVLQVASGYGYDGADTRYWCTACSFELFV